MTILDQYGQPIDRAALKVPQTARVTALENRYLTPALAGLTPERVAARLRRADDGDLIEQHRMFADMEERDAHLAAEMSKRKLAVMRLNWDIVAPNNPSAAEKRAAAWVKETLLDAVVPLEDLVLALMDGVGHGFAAVEIIWRQEGAQWLPEFAPRPQEWFRLDRARREVRLDDHSAEGAALAPFGWVLHTHGTPKTGYLGRAGLYRCLIWPFLYKAYSVGDFAEYLETYGLPIVVGKYYPGASAEEKASLMRAVSALGHDARAIMPSDMQLEIQKITATGSGTPHLEMMNWCDAAQSKAILGGTLTSGTAANGNRALGEVHNEVRHDIRDADARQIAATITLDLVYPLIALNLAGIDSLRRCPRLVFDSGEAEDIAAYAEALPRLVGAGLRTIPVSWVHERLRIPMPADDEPALVPPAPVIGEPLANPLANLMKTPGSPCAALNSAPEVARNATSDPLARLVDDLARLADPVVADWIETIRAMLETATSLDEFEARLAAAWPDLPTDELIRVMAQAGTIAELAGMADVRRETGISNEDNERSQT